MKLLKAILKGLKEVLKAALALVLAPVRLTAPDHSSVEARKYWQGRTEKLFPYRRIVITTRK